MVDAVVSVLLDNLIRLLVNEGRQLLGFKDHYEETEEELEYMKLFVEEANRVKQNDKKDVLKKVISDLRDLVYDVDNLMADCQLLEQNCSSSSNFMRNLSPPFFISRRNVGKRLHKINLRIGKLKERMKSYLGANPSSATRDHEHTNQPLNNRGVMNDNLIVGLKDDSAKITGWILKENQPFMVIGIVGMGGIGKTTLAEKVCKSPNINSHFKHILSVSVSHHFNLADLVKRMLKKLKVEEASDEVIDLCERLKSELDETYLLVLEDVWQTDDKMWWENFLEPALPRRSGCCIIVTTRNEEVAKAIGAQDKHIHHHKVLSELESWSLFSKVAFVREGEECINHELECIGEEIVAKCGGLPLAIKIVGRMMSKIVPSIDEWKRISKHLKEEMLDNKKDQVTSSLQLSYDELPSHLKPCFLSFAMYPKGFEINTRNMIYGWIGEGFVWERNGKTAYEFGEQCFAELLSRCLILGESKDAFDRTFYTWKMHDLVRDMVIKMAREENFMCVDEKDRWACRTGIIRSSFTETFKSSTKLRALVGIDINCKKIGRNICKLKWLRVLYLSFSRTSIYTEDWMSAIGSLPHLVYLTIGKSTVKKLPPTISPDSLGNLRNLQIFRLFNCPYLKSLPPTISNLEKLTILFLSECPLEFIPGGLGKLSKLEQLFGFKPTNLKYKNSFQMEQLKNLTQLREIKMDISSKDQFEKGDLNVLQEIPCLKVLAIDCSGNDGSIEFMEKLHHPFFSLRSLQELWLGDFPSKKTPPWLNPTTFPKLQRLYIGGWGKLTQMGPKFYDDQEEVWKIEALVLNCLGELEVDCQRIQKAMPKLRLLKISGCSKLMSFHLDDEGDGVGNGVWRKEKDGWRRHDY